MLGAMLLALLILPLYPLHRWSNAVPMDNSTMRRIIGLQGGCTLAFCLVLNLCTTAKRHEVFMATSLYMVVLSLFIRKVKVSFSGAAI
ncbi:Uu.00g057170.m01.CDS01 [Anthostomella pinea]|uniref:Uu.00g057170.m01.CDS01 n=1 Tax=Anthostomella pinea TaxID=933095 RepID=A0AAI8VRM9_9PEZI|nr:Uu.00g057170.m01.CDS01 [Anthostomella pinea]